MNRHIPRLVAVEGGWMLRGFLLPGTANRVFRDYVTARAHLLAARRWRRELQTPEVAEAVAELAVAELTQAQLALERGAM